MYIDKLLALLVYMYMHVADVLATLREASTYYYSKLEFLGLLILVDLQQIH